MRNLENLVARATHDGAVRDEETRFDEVVRDNAVYGVLAQGHHAPDPAREGPGPLHQLGIRRPRDVSQASTIRPDEVHTPLRWHTEDKVPYDTLVRRAQYYIDHEWFLEAGRGAADPQGAAARPRRR